MSVFLAKIRRFISTFNKIALVVVVLFVIISLFMRFITRSNPINTDAFDMKVQRQAFYTQLYNPEYEKDQFMKLNIQLVRAFYCGTMGEACTNNPAEADSHFQDSILGKVTSILVLPYRNPPASGLLWVYGGLQNAGFVPKSYAAEGLGLASIRGFTPIWNLMRQISYLILVVIIVVIGFMIMFRAKINPQTVVSIESALPKIVLALIYITYSFAIAGFLIDLMYVLMGVSIGAFMQLNIGILTPAKIAETQTLYMGGNSSALFSLQTEVWALGNVMFNIIPLELQEIIRVILWATIGFWAAKGITSMTHVQDVAESVSNTGAATVNIGGLPLILVIIVEVIIGALVFTVLPSFLISLILFLTFLLLVFRILALLINSYIKLILMVIFAPILLMLEAIPGRNAFSDWIKSIIGELVAFPLVVIFLLTGYAITHTNLLSDTISFPFLSSLYVPLPAINATPNFTEPVPVSAIGSIIGMGIIFMIPQFIQLIRKAMGVKDLPLNFGLGTFFGGALAIAGPQGAVTGLSSLMHGMPAGIQKSLRTTKIGKFFLGRDYYAEDYEKREKQAEIDARNKLRSESDPPKNS